MFFFYLLKCPSNLHYIFIAVCVCVCVSSLVTGTIYSCHWFYWIVIIISLSYLSGWTDTHTLIWIQSRNSSSNNKRTETETETEIALQIFRFDRLKFKFQVSRLLCWALSLYFECHYHGWFMKCTMYMLSHIRNTVTFER